MRNKTSWALLLIRLFVGGIFIHSGLLKLLSGTPELAGFVGGAFHSLGLTFLTHSQWLTFLGVAEVLGGVAIVLGLLSLVASIGLMIVMVGAMYSKGWNWGAIEKDVMLLVMLVAIAIGGTGKFALSKCCKACCKKGCKKD